MKKAQIVTREGSRPASAEQRLKELGIKLPPPPEPFGAYAEAVQTGNLLFLSGMLPTEGHGAKFVGRESLPYPKFLAIVMNDRRRNVTVRAGVPWSRSDFHLSRRGVQI